MTSVTILPMPTGAGNVTYCAVANGKRSEGATVGQALDALTSQMPANDATTLVIIQNRHPDQFFNADQQARLADLMARCRATELTPQESSELDDLIETELRGAAARSAAIADYLKR